MGWPPDLETPPEITNIQILWQAHGSWHSVVKTKNAWEHELSTNLTDQFWNKAGHCIRLTTPCARLQLRQFNVLRRAHFSKSKLSEIYPNVADQCDRCHASACNLSHMFFFCPTLHKFWADFFYDFDKGSRRPNKDPFIAISGVSLVQLGIYALQSEVLAFYFPSGKTLHFIPLEVS